MATKKSRRTVSTDTSKSREIERRILRPARLRVDLSAELVPRPAVTPGLYSRSDVSARLSRAAIVDVVKKAGFQKMGGGGGGGIETYVELSPGVPWVDGKGWLEAAGTLQTFYAQGSMSFIPDKPDQEQGILYIWMDGLTAGDAYIAEIRVGGWSVNQQVPGTYHIGASDAAHVDIQFSGASQTLSVLIPAVQSAMSLITIQTKGLGAWLFDDVKVSHLGKLN